jgi:hypothetical protein
VPDQYPMVLTNNRIPALLEALVTAAKPPRFSQEFLRSLGFESSNDRAFIPLFRKLGFINGDGVPTEAFDALRVKATRGTILAEKLRELYADLFAVNTSIQDASDNDVRGAMSRITGKDATTVARYAATFKALANQADFKPNATSKVEVPKPDLVDPPASPVVLPALKEKTATEFHYNIQIHLPATTDVSIYNAIFRSLKENLGL